MYEHEHDAFYSTGLFHRNETETGKEWKYERENRRKVLSSTVSRVWVQIKYHYIEKYNWKYKY